MRYYARHEDTNASTIITKDTTATITGLKQRTEYGFQVRAKTTNGWGDFSPIIFKTTSQILRKNFIFT